MPRGLWLGLAALVVAAAMLLGPVATAPATRAIGNFQSEVSTHAPALAAALEGLFVHGPFLLADHPMRPHEVNGAMYEPITTLLMWPAYAVMGGGPRGFTFAWNVWHLLVLVGSSFGAWIWARAWLGEARDPGGWGAATAMALAAGSLFLHLSPEVGRTEATNYPLYALHGGLVFRAAMSGGRGAWALAAFSAVPIVWAGGYAAVFFGIAEVLLAAWVLAATPDRRRTLVGLVGVAVVAAIAAAPLAWALEQHPYVGIVGRAESRTAPSVPLSVLFVGSESLLRELPGYEVAPFVGIITLLAAAAAIFRWRAAAWPLAAGLLLYWVAAGPEPTVGGEIAWGPAALLKALPGPTGVLRGWSRIFAFAVPFFAVGAAALTGGRAGVAVLVAAFGLAETSRSRVHPASWWSLAAPAELTALREAGERPILLPMDGLERTRRWLATPEPPDAWVLMPDHVLFRYFQDALPNEPELFRSRFNAPAADYEPCALLEDAVALRAAGLTSLYLRTDSLPADGYGTATRALKAVFGVPREQGVWHLPETVPPECAPDGASKPATITLRGEDSAEKGRPRTAEERSALRAARKAERVKAKEDRVRKRERE